MLVVGSSKRRWNGGKRYGKNAKKRGCFVYFYDSFGKFHTKRVSKVKYYYYRYLIRHSKIFLCKGCGSKVIGSCPNCI